MATGRLGFAAGKSKAIAAAAQTVRKQSITNASNPFRARYIAFGVVCWDDPDPGTEGGCVF